MWKSKPRFLTVFILSDERDWEAKIDNCVYVSVVYKRQGGCDLLVGSGGTGVEKNLRAGPRLTMDRARQRSGESKKKYKRPFCNLTMLLYILLIYLPVIVLYLWYAEIFISE